MSLSSVAAPRPVEPTTVAWKLSIPLDCSLSDTSVTILAKACFRSSLRSCVSGVLSRDLTENLLLFSVFGISAMRSVYKTGFERWQYTVAMQSVVTPPVTPVPESIPKVQPVRATRFSALPLLWLAIIAGVIVGLVTLSAAFFIVKRSTLSAPSVSGLIGQPEATPLPEERSFTAVLVGYGGAGHDGSSLTDSILVAKILLEQKRVVLLSIPRDSWVSVRTDSGTQNMKINAVYALHGPEALKATLSQVTGWQVDRYFGVDFSGFTKAIDSLGGVTLTVERAFDDYEYPIAGRERLVCEEMKDETGAVIATPEPTPDDGARSVADEVAEGLLDRETLPENVKKYPCRFEHLHFDAGKQTLTGVQALKYARSRHSAQDGNDFNRARRQQNLILAVVTQVFSTNSLTKIPGLISTLRGNTATDFSALEIAEWLAKAPEVRDYPITSLVLTDKNYLQQGFSSDRQFVLQTRQGEFAWSQVQNWLRFATVPETVLTAPVIEILAPPKTLVQAQSIQAKLATSSAWPVLVSNVNAPRGASVSAQVQPLVMGIDQSILERLSQEFSASIDTSQISTASSVLNGPHVRVVWK
jgi:LCP family protein required for cell wall assembly